MANLRFKNIDKVYDNKVQAVFDFNLEIKDKEFIVFVGPSGCGKSTTLRMVAGLEEISAGELYINEKLVNDVPPKDRDIAMVFQSYALYPHMSVYDNMAFGLKIKKTPKEEIHERVQNAAKILEIEGYLDRKPKELSGGQRQRVALGRAIVRNPHVFLMDEPLSNLDAKLRVQMRSEIIQLHERVGATTIYVTHDQTEAMTMATRIVVMKDGYIQQIGTPKEIYNNPSNKFVAGFVGSPATNFLNGTYKDKEFFFNGQAIKIPERYVKELEPYHDKEVIMGVRPEDIHCEGIVKETYPSAEFAYHVDISELLGHESILHGNIGDQKVIAKVATRLGIDSHTDTKVTFDLGKIHFFDKENENRIV
ncbi:MAG: ABC transporter ATP-binding protein [Breznakia sp.]